MRLVPNAGKIFEQAQKTELKARAVALGRPAAPAFS